MAAAPGRTMNSFLLLYLFFFFFFFSLETLTVLADDDVALFSHLNSSILKQGDSLANNGSTLTLQVDCDLVLRDTNNMIIWNSGSVARAIDCIFWINRYGVAVVSDTEGVPLWTTGSPARRGSYALLLRPDGTLRIYGPSLWSFKSIANSSGSDGTVSNHRLASSSFDSSGYIMYSSDDFIYRPTGGALLKNGNYTLVLETTCTMHIRGASEVEAASSREERRGLQATAPTCKAQLSSDGELTAYRLLFPEEGSLQDVWLRTWGSDFTKKTPESIAALVDGGSAGELLIYPMKQTLA
ncbi:unnamed protein product [Musa acuminata subsp. burmannicoides]